MPTPLDEVCCARLPLAALASLAEVRVAREVRVITDGNNAWLLWAPGDHDVLRLVLPIVGVELFERRGHSWHRFGELLPCDGPPTTTTPQRLDVALTPAPVQPAPPPTAAWQPLRLTLVRDDQARRTSALRCSLNALSRWADDATTAQLAAVQGARCGDTVLLRGPRLPLLSDAERFWGQCLLVPLGHRPDPALPESALVEALGLGADEMGILGAAGVEVLPTNVFAPLTRAGVRLGRDRSA